MSNKYKHGDVVPTDVLCARLRALSDAVTKGPDAIRREFYMRVPAELDNDADLVISEAASRIEQLESHKKNLIEQSLRDSEQIEQLEANHSELVDQINKLNNIRTDHAGGPLEMLNWWNETFTIIAKHGASHE